MNFTNSPSVNFLFNMLSIWSFLLLLVLFKSTTLVISDKNPGQKWALLVAGSNGWYNYRHQADICHAYQILRKHGIPDSNIVVMMYDDIAYNEENKLSGKIINHPHGVDVYQNDVNVNNFMKILLGKEKEMQHVGSGKVIKSGPDDHIFINFVDHGGRGILCFPEGEMTIGELNKTLTEMHRLKKYGQMLIYIEACESGSMFKNILPNDIKIYATTAANARESSYACYFSEELETYLGDCYSVNWMENSDKVRLLQTTELLWLETVREQYNIVKFETNTSHVSEFGDRSVSEDYLSDFQGEEIFFKFGNSLFLQLLQQQPQNRRPPNVHLDAVSSRDVPLEILKRKVSKNGYDSDAARQNLHSLLLKRKYVDEFINQMVVEISKHFHLNHHAMLTKRVADDGMDFDCHTKLVHHFSRNCFSFSKNTYALKYAYVLTNLCNTGIPVDEILIRMEKSCKTAKKYSNIV
ncbi:Legumain [Trichinella nelsoni]|uniref:legumain n=1 Tax=Trichinella nelsoni TaxID=6336 RepID=A0A0V0RYQ7_9BILA|nr:Legumain [Trichinella nelsoni]